jgi:hypothetical protein
VKASFERKELSASLAEHEKCARERGPSTWLAAVPSAQLSIDLTAILASVKSRSATQAAVVEDAARLSDNRTPNHSAPPRPNWRVSAAPAILIVIGSLVGSAGYYAGGVVASVAPQAPPSLQKFEPPPETTVRNAEQTADAGPAVADAAVITPPTAAKTLAAIEPLAPGAAPPKAEAPVAEPTRPAKKWKKASADKLETQEPRSDRHAKSKPARVTKPRRAPVGAAPLANTYAEPAVISDARRVTQTITGALKGLVDVDSRALR